MLYFQKYTCVKCGRTFTKMVGGVVMGTKERELELRPVCDRCKLDMVAEILHIKK